MTRLGLEQAALVVLLAVLAVVEVLHHLGVLLGGKLLNHPVKITVSSVGDFTDRKLVSDLSKLNEIKFRFSHFLLRLGLN